MLTKFSFSRYIVAQDEENYSSLLQNQQNSTWRSNLLPRSRFLELTVFKKMLAQGLHMTRHESGKAKPTTVFADRAFRNLWWYKSVGSGIDTFAISSLLMVGTSVDPQSGKKKILKSARRKPFESGGCTQGRMPCVKVAGRIAHGGTFFVIYTFPATVFPPPGSTRQDVINIPTITDEDYPMTLSLQFSGASKRREGADADADDAQQEAQEIFFTCATLELYHIVLDGFGVIPKGPWASAGCKFG